MSDSIAFPVVGIGASAGGVIALEGFFSGLKTSPGAAIVVVTHLSPTHKSALHEVISRFTSLPVVIASDGMLVQPDTVYVRPEHATIRMEGPRFRLRALDSESPERKPIDIFFASLADAFGERCAGIILSGAGSDGTLGIKAIKARGGMTLAQVTDRFGPTNPNMPETAISAGLIDFPSPAEEMGATVIAFVRDTLVSNDGSCAAAAETDPARWERARTEICAILRNQSGHDFYGYKSKTFLRRVQRRMHVAQLDAIEAYAALLRRSPEEAAELFRDLLINVTSFFRDPEAFERLANDVIPTLTEGKGSADTIRVWVPGCATGEEVFSIGILLREHLDILRSPPRVQIFATDIDDRALGVARAGRYPEQLLDGVSDVRRDRFFVPDGESYVVSKDIRDLCVFSPHSVIKDPPFSRMDLVSCRNLLIYFGADLQGQVIPTFHYALKPGGYLFLGTSENIGQFDDLFTSVEKRHRIYKRRSNSTTRLRLPLSVTDIKPGHQAELKPRRNQIASAAFRQIVDLQVLERFAPPHVVVGRDGDIMYFSGRTGRFLEPATGLPSRQLLAMARRGLRLELRSLFRECVDSGTSVTREGISVEEDDGRVQMINLIAEPLSMLSADEPLFLIVFLAQGPMISREEALIRAHAAHDGTTLQLEHDLQETRERLQSIIEEYETALEELKSSNEELVSVNEELQSTNEELEASKEELVSLNEELQTVNAELNGKLDALDRANSDLKNLFESTSVATVFLDEHLRIRSFTPAMTEVFNVLPSDRGRLITDFSSRLQLSDLTADISTVFHTDSIIERRVSSGDGAVHYLARFSPYRDSGRRTAGVVITFINVTGMTQAE